MRKTAFALALAGLAACETQSAAIGAVQDGMVEPAIPHFAGEVGATGAAVAFEFDLDADEIITFFTESDENFDTVMSISDAMGNALAENDDRAPGDLQSLIVFRATQAGSYTVNIAGYGGASGRFDLYAQPGLDTGLSAEARTLIDAVVTIRENVRWRSQALDLEAGDVLVATTVALDDYMDTTLALFGPNGEIIAQNDDRGDGSLNSQIVFEILEDGPHALELDSFSGSDVGDVALSIAIDPLAEAPFNFSAVEGENPQIYEGEINNQTLTQSFDVALAAGETVYAFSDTISGDLDIVSRLLGPDGFPVALNDDRGDGSLNSAFAYTAQEAGTYTVVIERYRGGESAGEFRLSVSLVSSDIVTTLQEIRENVVDLSGETRSLTTEDFVVYYTLEGEDATSEAYAVTVGEALQHAYSEQVGRMGWSEPVRDEDGLYRAFIADADGSMGVTYPVETVFDNPHTADVREGLASRTVFLIENDFVGFEDKEAPIDSLMRATATHEFSHVVQFGYDSEEALDWLYESTASWIETVTVGHHQDATDYTETDFETPGLCWTTTEGGYDYSQWTFLQSLADIYGEDIVARIWANSVAMDGFETVSAELENETIPEAIARWRAQNYALDYELAPLFPRTVDVTHRFRQPGRWTAKGGLEELGANFIELEIDGVFSFTLTGIEGLELYALAVRDDEVALMPLAAGDGLDTSSYDHVGLMVFNSNMPDAPGACSGTGYGLTIAAESGSAPDIIHRFDATHFQPPTEPDVEAE